MTTIEVPEKDNISDTPQINRLPPELLAGIFILTETMYRHARLTSKTYHGFPDTATQVCRHWRETAIQTPELWTYIFISSPEPHEHARLYLSRSGTHLIHLDLVVRTPSTEGLDHLWEMKQILQLYQMLVSVYSAGGGWNRWGSFALLAGSSRVFFAAMKQVAAHPTPNLKFVSLQYEQPPGIFNEPPLPPDVDRSHTLELGPDRPILSSVQLRGLPHYFVFDRPKPLVSGLRYLALACGHTLYPVHNLSTLLGACTQLESLTLSMGSMKSAMLENPPIADLRVFLPSLRFFSLELVFSSHWGSHMLKIIDAPGVETFLLFFEFAQNTSMAGLVRFISSGRLNGALQEESAAGQPGAGPIFPSLRTLALPHFPFNDAIQADLLNAYASAEWYF